MKNEGLEGDGLVNDVSDAQLPARTQNLCDDESTIDIELAVGQTLTYMHMSKEQLDEELKTCVQGLTCWVRSDSYINKLAFMDDHTPTMHL